MIIFYFLVVIYLCFFREFSNIHLFIGGRLSNTAQNVHRTKRHKNATIMCLFAQQNSSKVVYSLTFLFLSSRCIHTTFKLTHTNANKTKYKISIDERI